MWAGNGKQWSGLARIMCEVAVNAMKQNFDFPEVDDVLFVDPKSAFNE